MKYTNLAVEFLVIGFIFSLCALFGIMIIIGDYSLKDLLSFINSLKAQWFFFIAFFFYINGLIIHRSLALLNYEIIQNNIENRFIRFFLSDKFIQKVRTVDIDTHWQKYFKIHHDASPWAIEKINFYEKKLVIYKAMAFILPILSFVGGYWLYKAMGLKISLLLAIPCFSFGAFSFMSFFLLKHVYVEFITFLNIHIDSNKAE